MAKLTLFLLCAILATSSAQQRFRPSPAVSILSSGDNSGRYRPDNSGNDGQYVHDYSGSYSGNDGRYVPDDSGKYNPDNSGAYSGDNGRYQPDGSGRYTGSSERYSGGSGAGGAGGARGAGGAGSRFGAGSGIGAGARRPAPAVSESVSGSRFGSGSGISPAGGFGAPAGLQQGSAAGFYDNRNYRIIRLENDIDQDGYHYLYETENGITGEEQGRLENRGTDQEAMRAHGFFTYTGPDSVVYTVRYTADENGFVPEGAHLPTPPPIPEAIARALEYQRQQGTL